MTACEFRSAHVENQRCVAEPKDNQRIDQSRGRFGSKQNHSTVKPAVLRLMDGGMILEMEKYDLGPRISKCAHEAVT